MPLAAYFRNVGAVLVALLLIADFYMPKGSIDRKAGSPPVIRIGSDQKWPDRIVFDTTQARMAAVATAAPNVESATMRDPAEARMISSDTSSARDAFARASHSETRPQHSIDQSKRQLRPRHVSMRSKKHMKTQVIRATLPKQFAWFGMRPW